MFIIHIAIKTRMIGYLNLSVSLQISDYVRKSLSATTRMQLISKYDQRR